MHMRSSELKLSLVSLFGRVVLMRFIWLKNHPSIALENGAQRQISIKRLADFQSVYSS